MQATINFAETIKAYTGLSKVVEPIETASATSNSVTFELSTYNSDGLIISFIPSNRKKTRKVTVNIEGEFTILNTSAAIDKIVPVFENYDVVNINLKNISTIDLAAIQCLYTIKSSQEVYGKTICLESEFSKEHKNLIHVSGLLPLVSNSKLIA